jgi:DNA-binding SARP family transcriptional activator
VLGAIQFVRPDGSVVDLPSANQRRLLAVLALHAPGRVRAEWLADVLQLSASGLRTGVSRLRKALDDGEPAAIAGGYQLRSVVDAHRFSEAIGTVPPERRLPALEAALGLWGGSPFEEFADEAWSVGEVTRLVELHAGAVEDLAAELVAVERWSDAIAALAEQVARHPLRDRSRGLLVCALAGAGRQADALRAYRDYRVLLADELGTEPSFDVQRIARRVAEGWSGSHGEPRPAEFPPMLASARVGPYVGRAELMTELCAGWRTRRWQALLAAGEPGIGKSRLLAELAHRMHAAGRPVVVGRCDEDYMVSYRPWIEVLEPLCQSLGAAQRSALGPGHLGELARILPTVSRGDGAPVVPTTVDVATRQAVLADAIVALLRVVGPLVLVLDDLQWVDRASLRVLRRVVRAALPELTVLGAYRDTEVARAGPLRAVLADLRQLSGVRRLPVGGLDDAAVAELIGDRAGQASAVRARTAGNPLFVLELVSHLADGGGGSELPVALVELIEGRLSRLGEATVGVLQVAAAAGLRFDVGVVEQAAALWRAEPAIEVAAALESARDAGVIIEDGVRAEFHHAVIRDALLAGMSISSRRRVHGALAAVLEPGDRLARGARIAEIAYHQDRAGSPSAAKWWLRAATVAVSEFDASAVERADRGLELLTRLESGADPELRCDLLTARLAGLRLTGAQSVVDGRRAADAAAALGDGERLARALLAAGVPSSVDHDIADYVALLADGLAQLSDQSSINRWRVAMELCLCRARSPAADATRHRRAVLDVVAHLDPGDPTACQLAMRGAWSLTSLNLARDAHSITERFAPGCRGVDSDGWPVGLGLSTMWLHLGERSASDRYLEIAADNPLRHYQTFDCRVRQRLVMRHLLDARWSDAAAEIAQVRSRAHDDPTIALESDAQANWLRRETGGVEENVAIMSALTSARPELLLPQAVLAADAAEAGRGDLARAQLDRLAADGYAGAGWQWMPVMAAGQLAWAAVTIDAREHASVLRRLLADYEGQLAVIGEGLYVLCAIDRLLAGLADLDGEYVEADRLFAAALDQERAVRSAALQARTRHWWGRALLRRGDHAAARPLLAEARAAAYALEMHALVAQIDALQTCR